MPVMTTAEETSRRSDVAPQVPAHLSGRLAWADTAKGLGMVLVYYGHLAAAVPDLHGAGLSQMRFIYAFHMPLFFLLSGIFFRPVSEAGARCKELAIRRLVPVVFFSAMLVPLWMAGPLLHHMSPWATLAPGLLAYLHGHPDFNWVTWFLVCLWVCECMALGVAAHLRGPVAKCIAGIASIWLGVFACNHADLVAELIGVDIRAWFVYEALVALGFLLVGMAVRPAMQWLSRRRLVAFGVFLAGMAIAAATVDLNFALAQQPVMMAAARHGEAFAFALTALAGIAGVLGLSVVLDRWTVLQEIGRHSIALLGLSGLFFHFVNKLVLHRVAVPESAEGFTAFAGAATLLSLAAMWPVARWLHRHVPAGLGEIARTRLA
jgi:fucose 4-O-acetylase-like acetyltransferase